MKFAITSQYELYGVFIGYKLILYPWNFNGTLLYTDLNF